MSDSSIVIRGAREHNLQDVDVTIPRDQLVVITGLSGSGKSSLAFDTIYAEGQRRYVESPCRATRASSWGRWISRTLTPSTAFRLRCPSIRRRLPETRALPWVRLRRSTTTCVLLFARIGVLLTAPSVRGQRDRAPDYRPGGGQDPGGGARDAAPMFSWRLVVRGRKGEFAKLFEDLRREGFSRVRVDGEVLLARRFD